MAGLALSKLMPDLILTETQGRQKAGGKANERATAGGGAGDWFLRLD
jgi:hypothetical protein